MQTINPLVGILMGSRSDWETMKETARTLAALGVAFEAHVASAHRTPDKVIDYVLNAEGRGIRVLVAAAGGAAHLAGVCAGKTHLPVLGVPMKGWSLDGMDSLLSTVQMPAGIPVGTLAIGKAGATNAALLAAAILALGDPALRERLLAYRKAQTEKALADDDLSL
ncbi:5-(carboxyamino)imidazole ribonucleotide mutase [Mesoterricola silvestris]|uniref:N5-carboxyaminoimidazole ribonucleotide mutase n=1 Tax=Mesoterricola silvestris TaxID=2927979 RepID=A0AA48GMY8_9BACT|nr:5-(carboxyamino)imidazole ribonucleotide mutase [Mesoterricola silvestris]BDU72490.1 N5-carboxyaminoimidazole ribonucleotide mutase [Mesoterricola silvestris]